MSAGTFRKVLVANRGEIAIRVIRTLREMGIGSVAVHSEADARCLHVALADEAVCIGPPAAKGSYLNVPNLISAAEITGCDAIHPGYGFLAENGLFAEVCGKHGLTFIGPPREAMEALGDKSRARARMIEAGVPVVPGSPPLPDAKAARAFADRVGYPVLIKASGGGGGRGMRIVRDASELQSAYDQARREAGSAFGNDECYLEKYVTRARHVEVQIVADGKGSVVHFGERDCSTQRRHQKLLEESPAPGLTAPMREELCAIACRAAAAAGYVNAGTVEFILDVTENRFYFMEMNARIQVEHPVTELVTGIDLIREQILVAAGAGLSVTQDRVRPRGHAIECRINAEDPANGFAPSCGTVAGYIPPGGFGVRMDSHLYAGYEIPPHYDSLLGKLLVHGRDRDDAIRRMKRALVDLRIDGVATSIPFHLRVLAHPAFVSGDLHTGMVEEILKQS